MNINLFYCSSLLLMFSTTPLLQAEPLRPATITWGGVDGNDQLIDAESKWPFVQKYMDGFVLHGYFWQGRGLVYPKGEHVAPEKLQLIEAALGHALKDGHKEITLESGLNGDDTTHFDPAIPTSRSAYREAKHVIESLAEFSKAGIEVNKVRVDWLPLNAAGSYAQRFQNSDARTLLALVTGADIYFGRPPQMDISLANWREYVNLIHVSCPNVAFGFDQAPCNFSPIPPDPAIRSTVPWAGFGYGYDHPIPAQNSATIHLQVDFADLLNSVSLATRAWNLKFSGFECDVPYGYLEHSLGKVGKDLGPFLLAIERSQHKLGFPYGKIINDGIPYDGHISHDAWDQKYHDRSLQFLEAYQAIGGRSDQYIFESWYAGPFTLFPEIKPGTYTNLVRDAIRRIRGIDDQGKPFEASLSAIKKDHNTYEIRVTNKGTEVNKGDCRATMLVRGESVAPISVRDSNQADLTEQILAHGESDGWFVGGLEPGQSRSFFVTVPDNRDKTAPVIFRLYWNPQDPKAVVRATVMIP